MNNKKGIHINNGSLLYIIIIIKCNLGLSYHHCCWFIIIILLLHREEAVS